MNHKITILRILPFICHLQVNATSLETVARADLDQMNYFSRDLQEKVSLIADEEMLDDTRDTFVNAFLNNRNAPLNTELPLNNESTGSLDKLIKLIYMSENYKEARKLFPKNVYGTFLDRFAFEGLGAISKANSTKNSVLFPFNMFSNLFIDTLLFIAPNSDIKKISELLAIIEVSIDSIYTLILSFNTIKNSEKANDTLNEELPTVSEMDLCLSGLKLKLHLLRETCAKLDAFTTNAIELGNQEAPIAAIYNAVNFKNYFSNLGQTVNGLVKLYTEEPSVEAYFKASTGIFELFKFVTFFVINKEKLIKFNSTLSEDRVGFGGKLFNVIKRMPTAKESDFIAPRAQENKEFYTSEFLENAKSIISDFESSKMEIPEIILPLKMTTLEMEGNDENIEESEKSAPNADLEKKDNFFITYLIQISLVLSAVAVGLVFLNYYLKKSKNN